MHVGSVKSQHKDDKSTLKGVWSGSLNFDAPNDVYGMAEARIVKFWTPQDCIKS